MAVKLAEGDQTTATALAGGLQKLGREIEERRALGSGAARDIAPEKQPSRKRDPGQSL
jgi:hypothetical protein